MALFALLWWAAGAFWLFPLGWVCFTPFFRALESLPARSRFKWGYFGGFCAFFLINWWIIPTIGRNADAIGFSPILGWPLGIVAVALIGIIHGVGPALLALIWNPKIRFVPLWAALFWWIFEWWRCVGPIAHSWGALAFSQVADKPFLSFAILIGQHGLSALCVLFAACVGLAWRDGKWPKAALWSLLMVHGIGFVFYTMLTDVHKKYSNPLGLVLVQTHAQGSGAADAAFLQATKLTRDVGNTLVVWPETTAIFQKTGENYSGLAWAQIAAEKRQFWLLTGGQSLTERGTRRNEAVLVAPTGKAQSSAKGRLVPFGESAPFAQILPFLRVFAPQPEVEAGETRILDWNGLKIGALICFESCFPSPANRLTEQGAQMLFVLTNDEWFAGTEAPRQHMAMAMVRAVENESYVAQAANGGYTFVVNPQGEIVACTPFGVPTRLEVQIR